SIVSLYAHLIQGRITVNEGDIISKGEQIGFVGNSGEKLEGIACPEYPGTHIHLSLRKDDDAHKPEPISGYTNLVAGMRLRSDNAFVRREGPEGLFSIFASAISTIGDFLGFSSPPPEEPLLETTPIATTPEGNQSSLETSQETQSPSRTPQISQPAQSTPPSPPSREVEPRYIGVQPPKPSKIDQPSQSSNTSPLLPIAGVGGPPSQPLTNPQKNSAQGSSSTGSEDNHGNAPDNQQEDRTPPNPPIITEPSRDFDTFSTTTVLFGGTTEQETTISNSYSQATTSVHQNNDWSLVVDTLPQGTTTIEFFATDRGENKSSSSVRTIFVDSTPPSIFLNISECNQSISSIGCLTTKTELTLEWNAGIIDDLQYFVITCESQNVPCQNFAIATTTATSTRYAVPASETRYTFRAKAVDIHGNESSEAAESVEIVARPLIINEIAWAGTSANRDQDEWLELFNPTNYPIDLSEIRLRSLTDSKPNINLSGTLMPRAYYIVERTDDTTISDIAASTTASFGSGSGSGLLNSGEALALEYRGTILDQTPDIAACHGWCGGIAGPSYYYTMERYDPLAPGSDPENWATWQGFLGNGKNADGDPIKGTPGKRNSINYFIAKNGVLLNQNKILTKANSPYLIPRVTFIVGSDATLTIEQGTIIKLMNGATLLVRGKLDAKGTEDTPVIFTSFQDDSYGGDTNQDGAASEPHPGDWDMIKIISDGSSFDHAVIRYGGREDPFGAAWANIRVENTSLTVQHSTIEHSALYGIWLKDASGTIESNVF
ncbi:lamin tail domain-containing protein, partial [Candidatus Uhrbacteria bacterium]|nr:lamin tail domain-containing protein [Candidatus Uhrbacteria bacterium]